MLKDMGLNVVYSHFSVEPMAFAIDQRDSHGKTDKGEIITLNYLHKLTKRIHKHLKKFRR